MKKNYSNIKLTLQLPITLCIFTPFLALWFILAVIISLTAVFHPLILYIVVKIKFI